MKQKILDTINDLCSNFLFYDRKEDEDLSMDQLNVAVKNGEITVDEMVAEFRKHLEATFNDDEWKVKYQENNEEKERLFKYESEAFEFYEKTPYPKALWDHRRMEFLACIDENGDDYC